MKQGIHPQNHEITIRCACGNSFPSVSTQPNLEIDICSGCHPLFTGQQKFVDTAGRIEKFQARYAKAGTSKTKTKTKAEAVAAPAAAASVTAAPEKAAAKKKKK